MSKYKVGDRVMIRQWEDMEREFGFNSLGGIAVPHGFVANMRHLCGRTATIQRIGTDRVWLNGWDEIRGDTGWHFSPQMLEPVTQEKIVITHDGKTTTARLYDGKRVLKDAKAVCGPDDEFSFDVGARLAFIRLLGADYHPSEVAFKPAEPKPEPVKLYCVKEYEPGEHLTKGKVYEVDAVGLITFDNGMKDCVKYTLLGLKMVPNYLIPLVSRPAKVGEWVYALQKSRHHDGPGGKARYATGQLLKCTALPESRPWAGRAIVYNGTNNVIEHTDYLVLDGYQPEPEYYNGKAVCICDDLGFTKGKVYTFADGVVKDNDGSRRPKGGDRPIESLDDFWVAKRFIEFKGEA